MATASDEAFAYLLVENYWDSWSKLDLSNSEFGIQSWMMMKMMKRSKYWKRNKVKGQR